MAIRVLYSTTPPTSTRGAAPPTDSSSPRLRPPSELLSIFFPPPLELLSFLELPLELSISSSEASCTVQQQQQQHLLKLTPMKHHVLHTRGPDRNVLCSKRGGFGQRSKYRGSRRGSPPRTAGGRDRSGAGQCGAGGTKCHLYLKHSKNDISILGSYWVVDSSLFCQKLTLHGKILAGNKTKKNQNFSEILEKVEGEGHLFPWRTIYIMYYSMYIHVVKLAHGIRNGAASVDGVDAKLRQVVPETIQEDVIFKMSAPPKSDAPLITSNDLAEADGAKIGDRAANKHVNDAMYFIGLGSNDYVNNFLQPFMADGQQYTHDEFVELLTSTLDNQLTTIYKLGARKVIFHGLGPLGCIPSQRVKSKTGMCLKRVNEWVMEFNTRTKKLLEDLNKRLPGAKFAFADTYPAVLDLIDNPTRYGFKVANTSCCNVDTSVGGLCLPNSKMCKNRKDFVFWDAFHPSDSANQILADQLFSSLISSSSHSHSPAPAPKNNY
uniref:GDSL esterase/lipase n=1 Tax=Brassica campestris TaxID=3711 RepID=M4EH78_BRACM